MGIINRLPSLLANQIAAGEVVGSPASLIKELIENSVDAGASYVIVSVKEGGKKSIQVIDDGVGMTPDDALLAFERHATSKIKCVEDLFNISTFGFRGEALASIAAVAEVALTTKKEDDELGTLIEINGGEVVKNEEVSTSYQNGTQISVKNLFYNIPARKKSLKSDSTETKHITTQFQRVALAYHHIAFSLYVDDKPVYMLGSSNNIRHRIKYLLGNNISSSLVDLYVDTSIIEVKGYIGKPELAKKRCDTFFFVNGRYFDSPYFYKAVQNGFDKLLPEGMMVPFFIYLKIDPENVDVNITPTKTSVKFDQEGAIWQIINAVVRESLGKNGIVPMIDFSQNINSSENVATTSVLESFNGGEIHAQTQSVQQTQYNPFDDNFSFSRAVGGGEISYKNSIIENNHDSASEFEYTSKIFGSDVSLDYENIEVEDIEIESGFSQDSIFQESLEVKEHFVLDDHYGVASINNSLYIFDCRRMQLAINFARALDKVEGRVAADTQKLLFPIEISLSAADKLLLDSCDEHLRNLGFIFESQEGESNIVVEGVPSDMDSAQTEWFFEDILSALKFSDLNIYALSQARQTAASIAKSNTRAKASRISAVEFKYLVEQLFTLSEYSYTYNGEKIFAQFTSEFIKNSLQ